MELEQAQNNLLETLIQTNIHYNNRIRHPTADVPVNLSNNFEGSSSIDEVSSIVNNQIYYNIEEIMDLIHDG